MNILIVESKAKCKTLLKHLGRENWRVLATGGHVEKLPSDRKIHPPKEVKKAYWLNRPGELPNPPWCWTERGEAALNSVIDEAEKHDSVSFYLAADPDREGERIAWHLEKLLKEYGPCYRVTFNEITKPAVLAAIKAPRPIDGSLVDAALVRAFIDRLMGWRASNIAKPYTSSSTDSMGRVQTPALGFVVERELEREAHVPIRYFEVLARTSVATWHVHFHDKSEAAAWIDEKGRFVAHRTSDRTLAASAQAALTNAKKIYVDEVKPNEKQENPRAPFSTDTLIQAAGSRWGWSPRKTAALAGQLYEAGYVTYIRTDSTRIAVEAVEEGRKLIAAEWGAEQLGADLARETDAGSQGGHEAIRPTALNLEAIPDSEPDAQKLYSLIRARTLASLMAPSLRVTLTLRGSCDGMSSPLFGAVGWYEKLGWRRAFTESGLEENYEVNPVKIAPGMILELTAGENDTPNPEFREDQTKPPARYKAHTLVKKMKDNGIGRPSTYASTVEKLELRKYVTNEGGSLVPTLSGRNIWLMAAPLFHIKDREIFSTDYTADMECRLDDVAHGRRDACTVWEAMRDEFKAAHLAAQEANKTGQLLPQTRRRLQDYLDANPGLGREVGEIEDLTEEQGRALIKEFKDRNVFLLPTEKQMRLIDELLESLGISLVDALEQAYLVLKRERMCRDEASRLIGFLKEITAERTEATKKQKSYIRDLCKKAELDEAGACALVEAESFEHLTKEQASKLIEMLKRMMPKDSE